MSKKKSIPGEWLKAKDEVSLIRFSAAEYLTSWWLAAMYSINSAPRPAQRATFSPLCG